VVRSFRNRFWASVVMLLAAVVGPDPFAAAIKA
jgi:hypothetical protein